MDLRRLQAFVAIAELKNFTKAAELLHIAQPALGLKIRKLEEDLEQQLFVRHSRGVMMTDAGKFLLPQARALLAQASALKQVMRDFSCPPHGRVVMGVPPNVMEGITGIIARRAIQELPDVNLNMVEGLSHTLEEWLDDGRLNLACVFDGSDETTGRPGQVLYEEPFVFVGNADALRPRTARSRWPRRCASRWWCRRRRTGCARCWKTRRASLASRSMCASRWNPVRS